MSDDAVPIHPAATVMLLRDAAAGIEVFMLRRTTRAAFAGGMYVFPGGRVDSGDGDGDAGYVMAAIRECFEEAGILLARTRSGASVADGHPALLHRDDVHRGSLALTELCATHELRPAVDELVWVARWITPMGEAARRFDTRFFMTVVPPGQSSMHDDTETIASEWVRPIDALRRSAAGELMMMPPTLSSLQQLVPHSTAADAIAWAKSVGTPEPILPRLRRDGRGKIVGVALPGDGDYAELAD
jgi:8-oxo-dGTP pyrophosphatase MutT (NUDIX family)